MEFISGLALILLSTVGYSSGASLGARGRTAVPGVLDLVVVVGMWVVALLTRQALGKWYAIALWVVVGLILGALLARARLGRYAKEVEPVPAAAPAPGLRGAWERWKVFSRKMGNYQSRVLMAFLYFTVVMPFGLGLTLLGDPLAIKRSPSQSNPEGVASHWQPKELPARPSLEEAGRQF